MAIFVILGILVFFHQEIGILGALQMRFELGPALAKSGPETSLTISAIFW